MAQNIVHETGYYSTGRISANYGARVTNPTSGPVFRQATQPAAARIPPGSQRMAGLGPRGRVYGISLGAPVRNPSQGPVFRQAVHPAQMRVPQVFSKGRVYSNPGGPVQNPPPPITGPVFFPKNWPARSRIPQNAPRGRVYSNPGAPIRNATTGPVFRQATQPIRVRIPQVWSKGRVYSNPGAPVNNPTFLAPFFQATQPIKARQPLPTRGRVYSNAGAPIRNFTIGPVFRQATQPIKARQPLPPKGRSATLSGKLTILTAGVQFYPATAPIRARISQNAPRGRVYSNPGAPLRNPTQGPVFRQATSPIKARQPLPPRGRTYSNPGVPVVITITPAPLHPQGLIRARRPLTAIPRGRVSFTPVKVPQPLAPFYPAVQAVRAKVQVPFLKGRVYSNPGTILRTGPVFRQATQPIQARRPLPPRGRVSSNAGAPIRNATIGPRFIQAVHPAQVRIPINGPRGRTSGNQGAPRVPVFTHETRAYLGLPYTVWILGTPYTLWQLTGAE